ncbi:hypothetical protein EV673_0338 [Limnobacter thiooxidans]|uniref:DUF2059 domain-containing protein n=1 Tax=Limnobacter thiooxidans TaxID=131080 RepID=A0AA86MIQ5_9BURK|nr:hypothetical protein EV673_0338 [Limnobacter thiooxidans]BET26547.1 hypothetical protein RGQ30_20480 [Limnobacter thiooxidans]
MSNQWKGLLGYPRFVLALCAALASFPAYAAPASKESVERLLEVSMADVEVDIMYSEVERFLRKMLNSQIDRRGVTLAQDLSIDMAIDRFLQKVRSEYNWTSFKPLFVPIYQETFDQQEVDDLIAFYETPSGRAFVNKTPMIAQRSSLLMKQQEQVLAPKIERAVEQLRKEINDIKR